MKKPQPNTTTDGQIACAFSVPWLDHFDLPIGNWKGCEFCDRSTVVAGLTTEGR